MLRKLIPIRRQIAIGAILGSAIGGAAVAYAGSTGTTTTSPGSVQSATGTPAQYAPSTAAGRGESSSIALKNVTEGLSGVPIQASSLTPPAAGHSSLPWTRISLNSRYPNDVLPDWYGELVQGGVADLMRTSETTTSGLLSGGEVSYQDASGTPVMDYLSMGAVSGGQTFNSPTDDVLLQRVNTVATQFGLTVVSVKVLHPLNSALQVTFSVPDNLNPTWNSYALETALNGSPTDIEGLYIHLQDSAGNPLADLSSASRVGDGAVWFADGQDLRFGITHGGDAVVRPASKPHHPKR